MKYLPRTKFTADMRGLTVKLKMAASASLNLKSVREALTKYLPYCGASGYSILALNAMNVNIPLRILGNNAELMLFHGSLCLSNIGIVVYLYNRSVFDVMEPPKHKRFLWSCFGSWMFNLGSLLFWAIAKELCPKNKLVRVVVALSTTGGFLFVATDYLTAIDGLKKGIIAERESED